MNLLKYLANDLQISVVLVGTADAVVALQTDPQMSSTDINGRLRTVTWSG